LTINDTGVVGTVDTGTQSSPVSNEIQWGQKLLDMIASATETTDVDGNGSTEIYNTSSTNYDGTLTGGTQVTPGIGTDVSGFEYVLGKYDGQNAGYVLFNVADYGSTIPEFSDSIWTNNQGAGYQLSHLTGFGGTGDLPEPGTVLLIGSSLAGFGLWRLGRKRK
jgi:hypothetical protein